MKPTLEQVQDSKEVVKKLLKVLIEDGTEHDVAMVSLATIISVIAHGLDIPKEKLCLAIGEAWDFVDRQQKGTIQ